MTTRSSQRLLAITNGLSLRSGKALDARDDDTPKMRIGTDFQAEMPQTTGDSGDQRPRAMLLWKPTETLPEDAIEEFVKVAQDRYDFSTEQALGILYWFDYDVSKALNELPKYMPFEDEWTMEDKVIFEQAYQKYGKNFQRIKSMLPSKPTGSLVKYYYQWKKDRTQLSMMDKKAQNRKVWSSNSGEEGDEQEDVKGKRLPKGIYLTAQSFLRAADDKGQETVKKLDREIRDLCQRIQMNKQSLAREPLYYLEKDDIEMLRPPAAVRRNTALAVWTGPEVESAIEAVRCYGDDTDAISTAVGSKSASQCAAFLIHCKCKHSIPTLLAEHQLKLRRRRTSDDILSEGESQLQTPGDGALRVTEHPLSIANSSNDGAMPPAKRTKTATGE